MKKHLEICCTSFTGAKNAQIGGADRIELCANLYEAGTTPSSGLIQKIKLELAIEIFVLIRPRGGDFVYTDAEFDVIRRDIEFCKELGVQGIVSGVLKDDFTIDLERTRQLLELARPLNFTFHRGFDLLEDQKKGLRELMTIGVDRVLTSGGQPNVLKGLKQLKELVVQAQNKIKILAGGGLRSSNIDEIVTSGCHEFHTTARSWVSSVVDHSKIRLNGLSEIPEVGSFEVDIEEVQALRAIIDSNQ